MLELPYLMKLLIINPVQVFNVRQFPGQILRFMEQDGQVLRTNPELLTLIAKYKQRHLRIISSAMDAGFLIFFSHNFPQ